MQMDAYHAGDFNVNGLKTSHIIFMVMILSLPISYATKSMLNMPHILWIDPALILAVVLFMWCRVTVVPKISLTLVLFAFISACVGSIIFPAPSFYDVFREPLRLLLNIVLFWVCVWFIRRRERLLVNSLVLSVIIQFAIAAIMWLIFNGWLSLSLPPAFLEEFQSKQQVWFGDFHFQRFMGTFWEGPPFGLFMFSCFIVFFLRYIVEGERTFTVKIGLGTAFLGIVASMADQVFLGLAIFLLPAVLLSLKHKRYVVWGLLGCLIAALLVPYIFFRVGEKYQEIGSVASENVSGLSGGERVFHIKNGLNIVMREPLTLITGIGPGRYGDYAVANGTWPRFVDMQVTGAEWLVEYGLLWTGVMLTFLWLVGRHSFRRYGWYGLSSFAGLIAANMFQANWKWEAWFVALAFLYAPDNISEK